MEDIVILAPAGTKESLKAAIAYKADAVYLGTDKFNARMKAQNFSLDTLEEWIDYAHLFGVKVYVTLNTMILEDEFIDACKTALSIYKSNADGIIVTDLGLIKYCFDNLKNIDLIASTQLSIANEYGAKFAQELGCSSVVLARECTYKDIEIISKIKNLKTEVFLHGAMCVSLSGQCYMSSMAGGNSGNRGLCAQPCRKKYTAIYNGKKIKDGYLLSMKDLCSANNFGKMIKLGATVFKIEGRNRRSEYVAQCVKSYKYAQNNNYQINNNDMINLKKLFNRGDYTNGYAFDNATNKLMSPFIQGHKGFCIGKITSFDVTSKTLTAIVNQNIRKNDGFKIINDYIECGNAIALSDFNSEYITLSYNGIAHINDEISITTDNKLLDNLNAIECRIPIKMILDAYVGDFAKLTIIHNNYIITVNSDSILENNKTSKTTQKDIETQLLRLGDSNFICDDIKVNFDENAFLPRSVLNNLRRNSLKKLEKEILAEFDNRKLSRNVIAKSLENIEINSISKQENRSDIGELSINYTQQCVTEYVDNAIDNAKDKLLCVTEYTKNPKNELLCVTKYFNNVENRMLCVSENTDFNDIIINSEDILIYRPLNFDYNSKHDEIIKIIKDNKWYLDLPNYANSDDLEVIVNWIERYKVKAIVANNIYAISFAKEHLLKFIGGLGLNISNKATAEYLYKKGAEAFIYSMELSKRDIDKIGLGGYIFTQGDIYNMTLSHCPYKLVFGYEDCLKCKCDDGDMEYVDELSNHFKIQRRKISKCYFNIINCSVLKTDIDIKYKRQYINYSNKEENRFTRGRLFKGVK
ncbi:MAG: DUF3656 domain-containing protein [Clostridia bacterium]